MSSVEQDIRDFLGWLDEQATFRLQSLQHDRSSRTQEWKRVTAQDIEFLVESYLRQYGAVGDGEAAPLS